jgi:putative Mg2+ transporter-C (MgtC) family protein
MLTNQYLYQVTHTGDPMRLGAQVVSGIGFLGAGTIMVTKHNQIKGLTTAAGLWAVACLGINIGVGNYIIAFGVFVAMLITMFLADKLEVLLFRRLMRIHVTILIQSLDVIPHIREALKPLNITLSDLEFSYSVEKQGVAMTCFLRLKHWTHHQNAVKILESIPGVFHIELLDI